MAPLPHNGTCVRVVPIGADLASQTTSAASATPWGYFAVSGLRAVTKPRNVKHAAPLTSPGSLSPSPVSELMGAVNLNAPSGVFTPPFLTYPGQCVGEILVVAAAPTVVLAPETQLMVPPLGSMVKKKGRRSELPPVLPPVHPLMVMALVAYPDKVLQVMSIAVHEILNGLSSEMVPSVPMHTDPVSVPGRRMPSPVSPVTAAVKTSALGLEPAFWTYPGHLLADADVSVGAPLVVVDPETHVTVPPLAKASAEIGCEDPSVFPPVHPPMTIVVEEFPEIEVHSMCPVAAPAVLATPNVRPTSGINMATAVSSIRRMWFPFVSSGVLSGLLRTLTSLNQWPREARSPPGPCRYCPTSRSEQASLSFFATSVPDHRFGAARRT